MELLFLVLLLLSCVVHDAALNVFKTASSAVGALAAVVAVVGNGTQRAAGSVAP